MAASRAEHPAAGEHPRGDLRRLHPPLRGGGGRGRCVRGRLRRGRLRRGRGPRHGGRDALTDALLAKFAALDPAAVADENSFWHIAAEELGYGIG
ncbi:hypothetical protein ACFQ1I_05085 [Kitasatospora arboriphila]